MRALICVVLILAPLGSTVSSGATAAGRLVIPIDDPLQLAVGVGSLWVTTPRALIRVDPVSGRVLARIALPAIAGALAVAGNQVWVATNPIIARPDVARRGSLFSIDARTNTIVGKPIRLRLPTGIAVAAGRLWITNGQHAQFGRVSYIDPATRRILGSLSTPGAPESIVSAAGSVWVGESDSGRVVRINPHTATIVGQRTETNGGLLTLAPTHDAIWVADDYHGRLLAIDPADGRISRRRTAPEIFSISAAGANLWALFDRRRELIRLNPHTGLPVAAPIRVGQRPTTLLATSTGAWVATRFNVMRLASTDSAWRSFRAHGVSVRYPPKWHATAQPLTPVTSPAQVLAVASYPLPGNDRGADGCEPKQALDRMPPGGAFVYGWDYGDLTGTIGVRIRDFPPRPKRFTLRAFARYECLGASYMLRFREAHRFFQIHVAFGKHATAEIRATVLRILDSFRAKPL